MMARGWRFFIFSLARELKMTVRQLLQNLDSRELSEWQAYMKEANKPPEKKQSKEEIANKLKTFLAAKGNKKRKRK